MLLQLANLGKQYGPDQWALKDVSLDIGPGITGLLGENGAGKSTLMRIITTISRPTSGRVLWNGVDVARDPDALRRFLGYLPQDFGVYPNLNAVEFLDYVGSMKGIEPRNRRRRIDELLQLVNLANVRKRPLGTYSGGMKQRLGIAQALLNDPQVLIVDEPTTGLDPTERVRFRNLLSDMARDRIILLSTHIVSDVEATASRIALMAKGRLLAHASPSELMDVVRDKVWETVIPEDSLSDLRQKHVIGALSHSGQGVRARIVSAVRPEGEARQVEPALEDAYLFFIAGQGRSGHE